MSKKSRIRKRRYQSHNGSNEFRERVFATWANYLDAIKVRLLSYCSMLIPRKLAACLLFIGLVKIY